MSDKCKIIRLDNGFTFKFLEPKGKFINIIGLNFDGKLILEGWMGMSKFISILEMAVRGKLGTKKKYIVDQTVTYGRMHDEFMVNIDITRGNGYVVTTLTLTIIECQQFVSILNKLLHGGNKYFEAVDSEE